MRLVSYASDGQSSFGVLTEQGVAGLEQTLGVPTLRDALSRYGTRLADEVRARSLPTAVPVSEVTLLPPIPCADKILCAGVNYRTHREEVGHAELPEYPTLFTRFNDSHVGAGRSVSRPANAEKLDWEGEIAVVIARPVAPVASDDEVFAALAGFSLYNDLSVRDWQMHASQWTPGKNFRGVGAFGPALVTADEIDDLAAVRLTTTVNDEVVQDAVVADLIFDIPALVRYITAFTELSPGDVIVTGTPGGVGMARTPPRFLGPGDVVTVAATGLGELRTPIA